VLEKTVKYTQKLEEIEELIYDNDMICKGIVSNALKFYGLDQKELDEHIKEAEKKGRQADRISVTQTLKHFVRDWADEGAKERNDAIPCILSTMESLKTAASSEQPLKVLLPGSGVGRLGHEVANLDGKVHCTTGPRKLIVLRV
jgi:carnosine N-methyltransferase